MPERNDLSTTAAVKTEWSDNKHELEESGEGKSNDESKSEEKGKDHAEVPPVPVRHDPWDGLRNAWAVAAELSQSTKRGKGTQRNQDQDQQQQHNRNNNHHPNGQRSGPPSAYAQNRWSRGGRIDAGHQKRMATATEGVTNGITETDVVDRGHASKRHKTDAARRHSEFWHPDGSVIIHVEKTEFRLHQSMLQKQSTRFATAFEETQKQKRSGRTYLEVEVDGHHLPIYDINNTTADDFAMLLTVIEEPICVTTYPVGEIAIADCTFSFAFDGRTRKYADEIPPMGVLAGVLRTAHALSFEAQRKWAERILERLWPAKLAFTMDPILIPHAPVALSLARTCGLRSVQKRASYELLRMSTFGKANIAAPTAHGEVQEDLRADPDPEMSLDELSRADLLRLMRAREQLVLAWAEIAGKAPTGFVCPNGTQTQIMLRSGGESGTSNDNDSRGSGCASVNTDRVHARWAELVHMSGLYVRWMADPFKGLQDLKQIPWKEEGFCKKCVAARTNAWDKLRGKLWKDLDVWLELTAAPNP